MKKIIKSTFIILLTCFSFYYTNRIIDYSKTKDPIMKKILEEQEILNTEPVNATIEDNEIISGKNGNIIDIDSSYEKMKSLGEYNKNLLVFISETPKINIENNYDKYIVSGNKQDQIVSFMFIIKDNTNLLDVLKILKSNNIKSHFFIDGYWAFNNINDINIIKSYGNYLGNKGYDNKYTKQGIKITNYIIKENSNTTKIFCYTENDNKEILEACKNEKLNTIKENIINTNYPYKNVKQNLNNGKIFVFKINDNLIKELNTIILYIQQKGYRIVSLNDLLNV